MGEAFTPAHRGGSGPPLVCLHGFTGTWRVWEPILPALERVHDVLAPTLAGHAGGPAIAGEHDDRAVLDAVERGMDEAGWPTAHVVGNSLGGYVALRLAERGRARSVVALAPAGGWAPGDASFHDTLDVFVDMRNAVRAAARQAEVIAATPEGRRLALRLLAAHPKRLPPALVAHLLRGAAACDGDLAFIENARRHGWPLDAERVTCPVRVVWGMEDLLLPWPRAAERYRRDWLPHADWVLLDGVGHCPHLDVPLETAELILGWTSPGRSALTRAAG